MALVSIHAVLFVVKVAAMEEKLRALHAKSVELETQLQVEARAKRAQQESNKKMANDEANTRAAMMELQAKVEKSGGLLATGW